MADRGLILKSIQAVAESKDMPADEDSLFDAGVLDSFTLTDLAAQLEENFGIKIPDADLTPRKFETVDKIDAYVSAKQK